MILLSFVKKHHVNILINPKYEHLRRDIETISENFNKKGKIIYKGRNILKKMRLGSEKVVVKKFSVPNFINQFIYSTFRQSKAARSYYNSAEIINRGFISPTPVAYIEERRWGRLKDSYYICIYAEDYNSIRPYLDGTLQNNALLKAFAEYTSQLHLRGIIHKDYSPGNILWKYSEESHNYLFCLVDVNRMNIHSFNDEYFKNLERLSPLRDITTIIAVNYAQYSHIDKEEAIQSVNNYSDSFYLKKTYKYTLKELPKKSFKSRRKNVRALFLYFVYRRLRQLKIVSQKQKEILKEKEINIYDKYLREKDTREVLPFRYNYYEEGNEENEENEDKSKIMAQ
jgi:hypothetical protein|nr:lipopolysaccharide kinase InaA family protein [Proteiniphilum sp. UBA5218]